MVRKISGKIIYRDRRGRFASAPAKAAPKRKQAAPVPAKRPKRKQAAPVPAKRPKRKQAAPVPAKRPKRKQAAPVPAKRPKRKQAAPVPAKRPKRKQAAPVPAKRPPRYVTVVTRSGDRVRDARTGRFVSKGRKRVARQLGKRTLQGDLLRARRSTEAAFFKGRGSVTELENVNVWSALSHALEARHLAYRIRGTVYKVPRGQAGFFVDKLRDIFDRYLKAARALMPGNESAPILMFDMEEGDEARLFDLDTLGVDTDLTELMDAPDQWQNIADSINDLKSDLFP